MDILRPQIEEPKIEEQRELPPELAESGVTIKNLEFLNYLGLKNELFNSEVIEKLELIGEIIPDVDSLMEADVNLGNPYNQTRLDKIYSYCLLIKQEFEIQSKKDLINQEKSKWQTQNT